ncbi:MAG: hypothetical protein HDS31_05475 [Bacteroides sp.]|nr:hypothetical protein [Bacteroides sp.]
MTKYRVTFIYGSWPLWADIERPQITDHDRRSFADLAQLAVHVALEMIPSVPKNNIAHDYTIWELEETTNGLYAVKAVYSFDTLANEYCG